MGIEEFMMYYGQQELQKLQKEEMGRLVTEGEYDINEGLDIGGGLLNEDFLTDEEDGGRHSALNTNRRSRIKGTGVDIDEIK